MILVPAAIEPQLDDQAVLGQQFLDLGKQVVGIGRVVLVAGVVAVPQRDAWW